MISINYRDPRPIYEQVCDSFRRLIISGAMPPETKMPSVRELAASLTINPNTIQKAFRALESQGYIYPVAGRGNFVSGQINAASESQKEEIYAKIASAVDELRYLGVKTEEIAQRIALITDERRGSDD